MRQYQQLKTDPRIGSVDFVPYEDLVRAPEDTVRKLANTLGVRKEEVVLIEKAAKIHGKARGRSEAMDRLKNRSWLKNMSIIQRSVVCAGLDRKALSGVQEKIHPSEGRDIPYTYDCDNIDTKELNRSLAQEAEREKKRSISAKRPPPKPIGAKTTVKPK